MTAATDGDGVHPTGTRHGKRTIPAVGNAQAPCPPDRVNRKFKVTRPGALWGVDFTRVHARVGFVCAAFVTDTVARRRVGWQVGTSATAASVPDAPERAIHARRPGADDGLIRHSDRDSDRGVP